MERIQEQQRKMLLAELEAERERERRLAEFEVAQQQVADLGAVGQLAGPFAADRSPLPHQVVRQRLIGLVHQTRALLREASDTAPPPVVIGLGRVLGELETLTEEEPWGA